MGSRPTEEERICRMCKAIVKRSDSIHRELCFGANGHLLVGDFLCKRRAKRKEEGRGGCRSSTRFHRSRSLPPSITRQSKSDVGCPRHSQKWSSAKPPASSSFAVSGNVKESRQERGKPKKLSKSRSPSPKHCVYRRRRMLSVSSGSGVVSEAASRSSSRTSTRSMTQGMSRSRPLTRSISMHDLGLINGMTVSSDSPMRKGQSRDASRTRKRNPSQRIRRGGPRVQEEDRNSPQTPKKLVSQVGPSPLRRNADTPPRETACDKETLAEDSITCPLGSCGSFNSYMSGSEGLESPGKESLSSTSMRRSRRLSEISDTTSCCVSGYEAMKPSRRRHASVGGSMSLVDGFSGGLCRKRSRSVSSCILPRSGKDEWVSLSNSLHSSKSVQDLFTFKPYCYSAKNLPSSDKISLRRVVEGRRGNFVCEVGCLCRKCHCFTFSPVRGRHSAFLRKCNALCLCARCHLQHKTKDKALGQGAKRKKVSSETNHRRSNTPSTSPSGGRKATARLIVRSHKRGHSRDRSVTPTGGLSSFPQKDAVEKAARSSSSERYDSEGSSLGSPKKRRERKEVHYICKTCDVELRSWCIIRRHLLSSEHLQAVTQEKRQHISQLKRERPLTCAPPSERQRPNLPWDALSPERTPQEHLMAGLDLMRVVAREPLALPEVNGSVKVLSTNPSDDEQDQSLETASDKMSCFSDNCSYDDSLSDVHSVTKSEPVYGSMRTLLEDIEGDVCLPDPPRKVLICQYSGSKAAGPIQDGQPSTFIRIDYKKSPLPKGLEGSAGSSMTIKSEKLDGLWEVARIKDGRYSRVTVEWDGIPVPFVNLGVRCNSRVSEGAVNLERTFVIKRDRSPPPSCPETVANGTDVQNLLLLRPKDEPVPSLPRTMTRVDYNKVSHYLKHHSASSLEDTGTGAGLEDGMSDSSIRSLSDEEALGERLFLDDSDSEVNNGGVASAPVPGTSSTGVKGDSVVVLDSGSFLSHLIEKLNSGCLGCHNCGAIFDGNSLVMQLYASKSNAESTGSSE